MTIYGTGSFHRNGDVFTDTLWNELSRYCTGLSSSYVEYHIVSFKAIQVYFYIPRLCSLACVSF